MLAEPAYGTVAQLVHNAGIGVLVARVDCTRFTSVAKHFSVMGFPTILFITPNRKVEYIGERNAEEIVEFAKRLNG